MSTTTTTANPPTKRPRDTDESTIQNKRRRHRHRRNKHTDENNLLDMDLKVNQLFKGLDPQLTADHYMRQLNRFGADLSPIEFMDLTVSALSIRDTSSFSSDRTIENYPSFLESLTASPTSLSTAAKAPGTPHTIIVCGGGLRSADVVRAVRRFQSKNCGVTKLFAKHMKMADQVATLGKMRVGFGVGTPARLAELMENGALKLDKLERIVVDASFIDTKKRGVMDMKDTMMPLAKFLTRKELMGQYVDEKDKVDLVFY